MTGYLTLAQASKLIPGRPGTTAIWRWCRQGVLARSGERVFLEHWRFGKRIYTTAGAVARFGKYLANRDVEHYAIEAAGFVVELAQRERTQEQRERDSAAALERMRAQGVRV